MKLAVRNNAHTFFGSYAPELNTADTAGQRGWCQRSSWRLWQRSAGGAIQKSWSSNRADTARQRVWCQSSRWRLAWEQRSAGGIIWRLWSSGVDTSRQRGWCLVCMIKLRFISPLPEGHKTIVETFFKPVFDSSIDMQGRNSLQNCLHFATSNGSVMTYSPIIPLSNTLTDLLTNFPWGPIYSPTSLGTDLFTSNVQSWTECHAQICLI